MYKQKEVKMKLYALCVHALIIESYHFRDGHYERIRRLMNSWRSDVNVWVHENLIGNLKFKAPKLEETALKLSSPGSNKDFVLKECHYVKPSSSFVSSPGIRKLFNESPRNSANVIPKSDIESSPPPMNCLKLRVLEVGGTLQSNAALCEAHLESPSGSQAKASEDSKSKLLDPMIYLVFFSLADHNSPLCLLNVDEIEVYPPW